MARVGGTDKPPIYVSVHAQDALRRRHPDFWERHGVLGAVREVGAALRSDRKAKNEPRWAVQPGRTRRQRAQGSHGTGLFVWPESRERVYVVRRAATPRGPGWVVATVLYGEHASSPESKAAAAG